MNSGLCEHCLRVAYLVTDMTILLGMDEKATMDVQLAAIYHDIGKTQIPEQVLNKPGKLTPGEYFIMKLHAEIGYRMIQCHTSPETAQMVLYHHEDYDGGGYFGLQGNDIPYGARILKTESLENRRISLWNQLCFMTLSQIQKIRIIK